MSGIQGTCAADILAFTVELSLHHTASYSRRIVSPLLRFPDKLVLVADAPMDEVCSQRRSVAMELRDTVDEWALTHRM